MDGYTRLFPSTILYIYLLVKDGWLNVIVAAPSNFSFMNKRRTGKKGKGIPFFESSSLEYHSKRHCRKFID